MANCNDDVVGVRGCRKRSLFLGLRSIIIFDMENEVLLSHISRKLIKQIEKLQQECPDI